MKKKAMRKKRSKPAPKSTPLAIAAVGSSIGFTELREAIYVNPIMVPELLQSIPTLTMQSGLPLKRYSIHTSIHVPITKAWIIDEDLNKQVVNFYGGVPGEEEQ